MSNLNDFKKIIDNVQSVDELEEGLSMLRDMIKISEMKEKIKEIESNISSGGRAMFYFFASPLSIDEVLFAAEKINGKILKEKNKKKDVAK